MTCLICGESAAVVETDGEYEERTCPSCGHCTGAALVLMKTHGWYFDIELTRRWITEHQRIEFIPTIDSRQAVRLIDV
jgi:DNA-directed RNA polymerase subunit RPC12/RpoP